MLRVVSVVFSILLGIYLFLFSIEYIQWNNLKYYIFNVHREFILLSIGIYFFEILLRTLRWKKILSWDDKNLKFKPIFVSYLSGVTFNNILPIRLGEVIKYICCRRLTDLSRKKILLAMVLDRSIDILILIILIFFFLPYLKNIININLNNFYILFLVILILLFFVYLFFNKKINFILMKVYTIICSNKIFLKKIFSLKYWLSLSLMSLIILITNLCFIFFITKSVGLEIDLFKLFILYCLLGLVIFIPNAPASVGLLQFAFLIFAKQFDINLEAAVAASIIIQIYVFAPITIIGLMMFILNFKKIFIKNKLNVY